MFNKASSALAAIAFFQQWTSTLAQSSTYSADLSTSTACPSAGGAHLIVARGSLEAPPYGVLVSVKDSVLSQVAGSTADGTIGYPNTLADYFNSESDGVLVARGLINDFVSRCPGSPLVLLGYSQGANIMGDALVGQMDKGFPDNSSIDAPLPDQVLSQVAAVILMGDPTFVVDESFHVGNASMNGSFPRQNAALFNNAGLASRTQSYCDAGDLFCAGGSSLAVHVGYVKEYGTVAASYIVKQIAAWYASHGTSSGASTAAASVTKMMPSATASASASKISACKSAASGTGRKTMPASASMATSTSAPSSSTSPSTAVSTGAASSINLGSAAGVGAVLAGLFAAFL